jgi:hypothetical protein
MTLTQAHVVAQNAAVVASEELVHPSAGAETKQKSQGLQFCGVYLIPVCW